MKEPRDEGQQTMWERLKTLFAILVAVISLSSAIGAFYVLPYRMTQAERGLGDLKTDLATVRAELKAEVAAVRVDGERNRELLVRIDERLRTVQAAMKLPTGP